MSKSYEKSCWQNFSSKVWIQAVNKKLLTKVWCTQTVNKIYEQKLWWNVVLPKDNNLSELSAELQHSIRLGKTFQVGRVGGWLRKAENNVKVHHSCDLGFAELGNFMWVNEPSGLSTLNSLWGDQFPRLSQFLVAVATLYTAPFS